MTDASTLIEETRARYIAERDKRLREDGIDQYVEVAGAFAHFGDDPYTDVPPREPVVRETTVAIIGAGFGGLIAGARLSQAGIDDFILLEKGGDVGGTWYWNRYPGAQCDVESYVYLPLLEETGYIPSERYAHAPEILDHCRRIAKQFDLYRRALLGTGVTALTWLASEDRWEVITDRGDRIRAQFVMTFTGPMSKPKLPGIPGIEEFEGHAFHTSRWDYDYTGGDASGGLWRLGDKRVALIGTGATAVQCVPHLAESAAKLYVVQRTPSSIDARGNRPTDADWTQSLRPGWQRERIEAFTALTAGAIDRDDVINDGWTDVGRRLRARLADLPPGSAAAIAELFEAVDFEKMDELRKRIDEIVEDPQTADALKPWYRLFCKRPCFHDSYLQSFNRPNVELVHTDGKGVDRITRRGFVVGETEREVDCLIFATGFEIGTEFSRRAGFDAVGRDGRRLSEHWADGVRTLHGLYAHGFPNLFTFGQGQGAFAVNYPHLLLESADHVTAVIGEVLTRGHRTFEVTEDAEAQWIQEIVGQDRGGSARPGGAPDCTPGYYNNEGKPSRTARQSGFYGPGPLAYFQRLASWRAAGNLDGLALR